MQRPTFVRVPAVLTIASSLPPMYAWPRSVKRAVLGVTVFLCIVAYIAMGIGILSLVTLAAGLVQ
jgi:hypothetical protein